ncbi:MAG: DUF4962 domain-containing protein [Lentisphaeria bacterium]|nr:DUF4962 domain-containing protein [Lentisphaeria bacterium]
MDPNAIAVLSWAESVEAAIVADGPGGGHCLRLETSTPSAYCQLNLNADVALCRNLVLEFDHREEIEAGFEGAYLGVSFYGEGGRQVLWSSDGFSTEWRRCTVVIPLLKPSFGVAVAPGLRIRRMQLYGRVRDKTAEKGATRCRMRVWFDNIRLHAPASVDQPQILPPYLCHNNPPLLDWPGPGKAGSRLQISKDPAFPEPATTTVVLPTDRPFYVPPRPLAPGDWYFRVEQDAPLVRGWSARQHVILPERTHAYAMPALPLDELRRAPRPRLLPLLHAEVGAATPEVRETLLRQARAAASEGVPEHPGPHREGDPRWPQWIDWYGQVADGLTARTGMRLKRAATAAMATGEPESAALAADLLLAACDWDPDGGSAARHGDLQAASLLQGMVWCYDACEQTLTAEQRQRCVDAIRRRTLQFAVRVAPFRMNPAQNHPWRQTLALAESALVLLGVLPESEEWLDAAAHAFALRILPSMGFAGENQEGITYWSYGVTMLADFADLFLFLGGVDLYDHPWLASTCLFPVYCAPPHAYAISFADTSSRGNASIRGVYGAALTGRLAERSRNPYALWYAGRSAAETPPRPPAELPQSVFYPHIGQALFHTCLSDGREDVAVGLRCGPYYAGHQHDDQNAFVIHAYGDKLAIDGGYYDWYGSPHFKAYSIRTLAHNTLLVDGHGQRPRTDGRITAFFDSPGFGWAVGDAGGNPEIYEGRLGRFDRRILFLKPGFVIIHDLIRTTDAPASLQWLLHAHTRDPFPAHEARGTFTVARPDATLHGVFLAPENLRLGVARSFDVPPQKPRASVFLPWEEVQPEWTLTAGTLEPVRHAEFVAVLAVARAGGSSAEPLDPHRLHTDTAWGCELRTAHGTYVVALRRQDAAGPLEVGSLRTDGDAAAVLLGTDGRVLNAFASRAAALHFGGRTLLRHDAARDGSLDEGRTPVSLSAPLDLDGAVLTLEGRRHPLPDGDVTTWWAHVPIPERIRATLTVDGWEGPGEPRLRLDNEWLSGTRHEVVLSPPAVCLTVTGRGHLDGIALRPLARTPGP